MTDLSIAIAGDHDGGLALKEWYAAQPQDGLTARSAGDGRGKLGTGTDLLTVVLAQGGLVSVAIHGALLWLRTRRSTVTVEFTKGKRTARVSAQQVRGLTPERIAALAREVSDALED